MLPYCRRPNYDLVFELPPRLDDWVSADHPARFLRDVVDTLDLAALGFPDRAVTRGRAPLSTDLLVKAWLYGFVERFRSTRRLEWACANVPAAIWLTGNERPDHNTLSAFFRAHRPAFRALFRRVVGLAADLGLAGLVLHAIDGTKMAAASSIRTADHRAALTDALARLDGAIAALEAAQLAEPDATPDGRTQLPAALADATARRAAITAALARLDAAGVDHQHPTEPDARVLGRTGRVLGYNAQAAADAASGLVVACDVTTDANDQHQLTPMLEAVTDSLGAVADQTVVDQGYVHGAHVEAAQEARHDVLLAGLTPSEDAAADAPFAKAQFTYDADRDGYVCPQRRFLPLVAITNKGCDDRAIYRCDPTDCPVRARCTKDPKGRTVDRGPYDDALDRQRARQCDDEVPALLARRKVIIEPVFAQIKWNDGVRRFTVRGLAGVRAQWALLCTALNLRKLYRHWVAAGCRLAAV